MRTTIPNPLERSAFNAAVLRRDKHRCVMCGWVEGLEVHHILNRHLWDDGCGNHVDNGVTLCSAHHIQAEKTLISCEALRLAAKISEALIPLHLEQDDGEKYDCWGNHCLANGTRLRGELFFDDGCQKMLAAGDVLNLFLPRVKYPRTSHLPWSPGLQNDDRVIRDLAGFNGRECVASIKMDGENTSLYPDFFHARSLDSRHHDSRNMAKALHAQIKHEIPTGWRICCENLQAVHSIKYQGLTSPLEVFNIWNERNVALSWDETVEYATMLGLPMVKVVYRGIWDEAKIRALSSVVDQKGQEGYVVRVAGEIPYGQWRRLAAKYVRAGHVQTDEHWTRNWVNNDFAVPGEA